MPEEHTQAELPQPREATKPALGAETLALARWTLGLLLIIIAGWGFIAVVGYFTYKWKVGIAFETAAAIAAIISLGLFFMLEQGMWLSRFMGLRIHPRSSPAIEALYLWLLGVPGLLFRSTGAAEAAPQRGRPQHDVGTGREVVETVVFVVVLVLLLKSFAAEAFVIPTGSMAETLYGYQLDVTCPKCGYEFPVNASNVVDPSDGQPVPINTCTCPNCRYVVPVSKVDVQNFRSEQEFKAELSRQRSDSSTGDRVLVAKFLYDSFGAGPNRLDVVVFKYPGDSGPHPSVAFPESGPQKGYTPMNYIKRLCGLPGETIGIWYGKLYNLPAELLPPGKKEEYRRRSFDFVWDRRIRHAAPDMKEALTFKKERGEEPEGWEKELWRFEHMFKGDLAEMLARGEGFQIIRKPPAKILDMRRIVYDNDHPPQDLKGDQRDRWAAADGTVWSPSEPHGFQARGGADSTAWLRYRHILRPEPNIDFRGRRPELITDFMGYNTYEPHRGGSPPRPNWVGDLLVECEVNIEQPNGEFALELSKGVDRFRAAWDLASGRCTLSHLKDPHTGSRVPEDDQFIELANKPTALKGKGKYLVRFANVDDRLLVWVDNDLPFGDGVPYEALPQKGPFANDLQPASIGVKGAQLQIHKLSLWRDTYYTRDPSEGADANGVEDWSDPGAWDRLQRIEPTTFYVQPGHYLCLGDNSPESSDGRSWGLVPERLLLGRALLVYYPFGRAGRIK
jgi:signal peptidase I